MSRVCLVGVQGPMQLCAGIIAMEWYGLQKHGTVDAEAVLLLYDFLVAPEQEKPISDAIMQMVPAVKWKKIIFIGGQEMNNITLNDPEISIIEFRKRIGSYEFTELFLARNFIGKGSNLILNSYPLAQRIAYGDGFGLVGTEIFARLFGGSGSVYNMMDRLKRLAGNLFSGKIGISDIVNRLRGAVRDRINNELLPVLPFHSAVLVLPVDYSGNYLKHVELFVPARDHVINIINRIKDLLTDLTKFCTELIANVDNDCYLYLFITPTESGCTTLNNEVAMYLETIRENSPRGSTVFIKLHPRKQISFGEILVSRLHEEYNVIVINQGKFKSLPVEFWEPLVKKCTIVSFSSSSLNLEYIYGKKVISGFSVEKVHTYFFPEKWAIFEDDYKLWREASMALKAWDNKSVLWSRTDLPEYFNE